MRALGFLLLVLGLIGFGGDGLRAENEIIIYFDSDRSRHTSSALAIEKGFLTALSEVNNHIDGRVIRLKPLNHRGNTTRSKNNMEAFLADESALFILGGLHSPPLIKHRQWINESQIPILVPWAAGGPITRYPSKENWVFRCSVDDTKAGRALAEFSTKVKGMKNPALVMEDTPWGQGNYKNVSAALIKILGSAPPILWFDWSTKEAGAKIKLRTLLKKGHDGIILVGNAGESLSFCRAMASLEGRVPIVSHWGITGGDFQDNLGQDLLEELDLSFIQTRFSFVSSEPTKLSRRVWARAQNLYPEELKSPVSLSPPTGFVHAYDLGKMAIEAIRIMKWEETPKKSRKHFRLAMESLEQPIEGLLKTYQKPFRVWSEKDQDAHEALGYDDLAFGRFKADGSIELIQ